MSKNDYSFSPSGGLMPLIQALIRPPDSRESSRQANKRPQHPYYRRPGRGHNRDCCDSCREGGDLICCDRCPASFHLGCHDPPLAKEDIPAGLWLCHMCQMLQNQRNIITTKSDENNAQFESRPSTPNANDGTINAAKIRLGQKRQSSRVSSSSENSQCIDKELKVKIQRIDTENSFANGNELSNTDNVLNQNDEQQQQQQMCPAEHENESEHEKEREEVKEKETVNIENDAIEIQNDNESCEKTVIDETTITTIDADSEQKMENNDEVKIESTIKLVEIESTPLIEEMNKTVEENVSNGEKETTEKINDEQIDLKTPLDELIKAASILNPRQFELPRELNIFPQFPGDDKVSNETNKTGSKKSNNRNGSNGNNKVRYELDSQGLVPLPAATCFYCRKSCKKAPLISCDYCPLFFHLDCLDPPLTALPTNLWMCPNHPEPFVDWKLVTSISATERIKLWNHFNGPVDHETIKSEFFRKIHCKNPPFRYKLKPKMRHCAEIPPMVEFHYKNPPPLLPSLRDVLRCERVYRERGFPSIDLESYNNDLEKDLQELHEANEKVRKFEADLNETKSVDIENVPNASAETNGKLMENDLTEMAITVDTSNVIENTILIENDERPIEKIENESHSADGSDMKNNVESLNAVQETNFDEDDRPKLNRRRKRNTSIKSFGECDDLIELSEEVFKAKSQNGPLNDVNSAEAIDEQLHGLDINVIKKLAFIQLQKILNESPEMVNNYQNESANKAIKDALAEKPVKLTLPSQLLSKEDIARIAEQFNSSTSSDENDETNPAYAGVSQPVTPSPRLSSDCYIYSNGLESIQDDNKRALAIAQRLERPLRESKIRARAVLTPVGDILAGKKWYTNSYTDDSIFMRYRSLVIGTGPNCDLQLKNARKCARFSTHHATIFYDDVTKLYEILNYSEHGTEVNGQLYSLDFTEYPELNENRAHDVNGFYKNIRDIIDKKRGVKRHRYGLDENAKMAAPEITNCRCQSYPPLSKGWEGSAILAHGSLLRFGCLAYVFSVIDNINDENN